MWLIKVTSWRGSRIRSQRVWMLETHIKFIVLRWHSMMLRLVKLLLRGWYLSNKNVLPWTSYIHWRWYLIATRSLKLLLLWLVTTSLIEVVCVLAHIATEHGHAWVMEGRESHLEVRLLHRPIMWVTIVESCILVDWSGEPCWRILILTLAVLISEVHLSVQIVWAWPFITWMS